METDWLDQLAHRMSFRVAAAAELCGTPGSHERELLRCVYRSLRADLELAAAQWQAERDRARRASTAEPTTEGE